MKETSREGRYRRLTFGEGVRADASETRNRRVAVVPGALSERCRVKKLDVEQGYVS